jgi:hypothetical protein
MNQQIFKLETIHLIDSGKINAVFEQQMKRIVNDCIDRPLDDSERSVTISFKVKPNVSLKTGETECSRVHVAIDVAGKVPTQKSRVIEMAVKQTGGLVFNPDLLDDPAGSTLYDKENQTDDGDPKNLKH